MVFAQVAVVDLTELGIEELMQIEVTSVSKKSQLLPQAAAAVFVLTQEDLRRSGVSTIPEALRMVPGINVAQLDGNKWAISARGFNHLYADKLLVLIDGRSGYSPLFSGVHWEVQDTLLEDIERIEVIRGPGTTLWGANAVNGVVNIITKSASETQGNLLSATAGSYEHAIGSIRHGGSVGQSGYYRAYLKFSSYDQNEPGSTINGTQPPAADDWRMLRTGFRSDWRLSSRMHFTLQGDYYDGSLGETLSFPNLSVPISFRETTATDMDVSGAHLLARWERAVSTDSDMSFQVYYDRIEREEGAFSEIHDTYDLEFNHRFPLTTNQEIIWGLGYRYIEDRTEESFRYSFAHDERDVDQANAFLQDEIKLTDDVSVILGAKVEHFDYTGYEVLPNARFTWMPTRAQTLWGAVSRAVRTPSRNDDDVIINAAAFPIDDAGTPGVVRILGNTEFDSEKLTAYELGYRVRPRGNLLLDIALYYNDYQDLIGTAALAPFFETDPPPPHMVFPREFTNTTHGHTYGVELVTNWQPLETFQLMAVYSFLEMDIQSKDNFDISGNSPQHQFNLRGYFDLTPQWELDTALYFVDDLNVQNNTQKIDSYVRLDLRLGWKPTRDIEISIGARNVLDDHHAEFGTIPFVVATEIERSIYAKVVTRF